MLKVEQTLTDLPARGGESQPGERALVIKLLANGLVQTRLKDGRMVLAHLSERLRLNPLRLLAGDEVLVQLSAHDPSRGRILRKIEGEG
jgi:translation initiation factor IF-1